MNVTQLAGLPVGKASLQAPEPGKRTPEKEERVARKRQRLVEACRHLIQGRRGLIVTYKGIEEAFAGIEGIETGHFGAIEGVDAWKRCRCEVIIGRPLPRPEAIEHLAAAVTGNPVVAGPTIETYRPIGPGLFLNAGSMGAGGRNDPGSGHRGRRRAGGRTGKGRHPDGGQPGRDLRGPVRHRRARPAGR